MSERIGWIGLGKMGAPMALNIRRAGHDLVVWNRSAARCEPLRAAGATVAADVASLAAGADILFVSVADDEALRRVALGEAGALAHMRPGSILIETSTVSVAISAEIARAAQARGIGYLRAPVSGSVQLASAGKLGMLVSGPRATFEAVEPILGLMTAQRLYAGDGEQARVLKLTVNMMVGLTAAMAGEAMAFCLRNGIDRATTIDGIAASVAASPLFGYKAEALKARDFSPRFSAAQMAKDFDLALSAGHALEVPMPLTALVRQGWATLIAAGEGDDDFFKYTELAIRAAGVDEA
ncbi:NAD(P)-dependent oxidoreductase [Bosea sp. (in: a-proteobacteria)]|uniref:NAD(P)-dependent oxidoreductase n=1 Tax=Bosea sp. (in: a-proteobacteria) TaxID=1871050 RepID=UPI00262A2096|nr:NAD(P)-dependent oxidoreductase [Bosea sp. (in: a-proteobacteria)]